VGVGISAGSAHFDSRDALGVNGGALGEGVNVGEKVVVNVDAEARRELGIVVGVGSP